MGRLEEFYLNVAEIPAAANAQTPGAQAGGATDGAPKDAQATASGTGGATAAAASGAP